LLVHNFTYSQFEEVTFVSIDPTDPTALLVTPALSFTPGENYIVDVATYPTSSDLAVDQTWKQTWNHIDPTVAVVSGTSDTVFTVGGGDIFKFLVGARVSVHNSDYSLNSPERSIVDITVNTITVDGSLGFTPSPGEKVEVIGFLDGGGAYRTL
jgi:hypothetical protein